MGWGAKEVEEWVELEEGEMVSLVVEDLEAMAVVGWGVTVEVG
jgi:hypothetical protein